MTTATDFPLFGRTFRLVVQDLDVSALDCSFEVERNVQGTSGRARIKVWNLSPSNRGYLEELEAPVVELSAGYQNDLSVLFVGDVQRPLSRQEGPDVVTEIAATDGGRARRLSRISLSLPAGSRVSDVVRALGRAMRDQGVGGGNLGEQAATFLRSLPTGITLNGPAFPMLQGLARAEGFDVSIQDGALLILERDKALAGTARVISPDSGLLDSPSRDRKGNLQFSALIQSGLEPGRPVKVESQRVTGDFRVDQVRYSGQTFGGGWEAQVKAKPL